MNLKIHRHPTSTQWAPDNPPCPFHPRGSLHHWGHRRRCSSRRSGLPRPRRPRLLQAAYWSARGSTISYQRSPRFPRALPRQCPAYIRATHHLPRRPSPPGPSLLLRPKAQEIPQPDFRRGRAAWARTTRRFHHWQGQHHTPGLALARDQATTSLGRRGGLRLLLMRGPRWHHRPSPCHL